MKPANVIPVFRVTAEERKCLIFQFGISSWSDRRAVPDAFTEKGFAIGFHVRETAPPYRTRRVR